MFIFIELKLKFTNDIIDGSCSAVARQSSASEYWTLMDHTDSRGEITPLVRSLGTHSGSVHSDDTHPEGAASTTNCSLGKDR